MYYIGAENKIYRIGDFQRKVRPELSSGRIVNNGVKRTLLIYSQCEECQGEVILHLTFSALSVN